jgi:hypothetical protein
MDPDGKRNRVCSWVIEYPELIPRSQLWVGANCVRDVEPHVRSRQQSVDEHNRDAMRVIRLNRVESGALGDLVGAQESPDRHSRGISTRMMSKRRRKVVRKGMGGATEAYGLLASGIMQGD